MAIADLFREHFGSNPDVCVRAPGRVNLIGEHIDYSGGHVMPFAISNAVFLAASLRPDGDFRLVSAQAPSAYQGPLPANRQGGWSDYVFGVVHEFAKLGHTVPGLDIAVDGSIPRGSGLSSSAALEVAVAWAIQSLISTSLSRQQIASLCQRAENLFVGVNCGIMDQTASACCRRGSALLLDCGSLALEHIPMPMGEKVAAIVAHSGVHRGLSASAYNERRSQCDAALEALRKATARQIPALCAATFDDLEAIRSKVSEVIFRRARHAISEQGRVEQTVRCLKAGEWERIGDLLDESHASLREDYEVSCPELDELTRLIRSQKGAFGSRLTGAGFGGCTISLVSAKEAKTIVDNLKTQYYLPKGLNPVVFLTEAEDGVGLL